MAAINPYLNFNGNTMEAFDFYKSVFGGEFETIMRHSDMPAGTGSSDADPNMIMHIALPIGKGSMLMGSDNPASYPAVVTGSNFWISISPESKDEADKIFNGLAAGGKIMMPLADAFWGGYFGMLADKFGIQWMVNYQGQ